MIDLFLITPLQKSKDLKELDKTNIAYREVLI